MFASVAAAGRKTVYKVYVAGVNGAGEGEWQETQDRVTTQGLGRAARTPITHTPTHLEAVELLSCIIL